jgi:L-aspartate oxidase
MTHPLIIAGAGIAGLWTALYAAPRRVILLTGSKFGENASTAWAQGGVAAALAEDDAPRLHADDTIAAGAGLVDEDAARLLAQAGPGEIADLYALGAPFEKDGETWALSREAAHSRARVARVKGDQAGAGILAALISAVKAAPHIDVFEGWRAEALLPGADGGCAGVLARDEAGALHRMEAADTVLATGSLGGLYAVTTTPWTSQGQALAMAAALGAVIRDPEFVQFHPTAIDIGRDPAPLATEALRGEGATLIDASGARFMKAVHADAELAPRDVVARAVHRQVKSGKGAFLDARAAVGEAFPERFPAVFAACRSGGLDPRVDPIPVAPAAHYHMGGIATDLDGFTGIAGLWAVGECACTGVHGANRLASNSLLDALVFGRRAAQRLQHSPARSSCASLDASAPGALPGPALQRLRQVMARDVGVERDAAGLSRLITLIDALEMRYGAAPALVAARFVAAGALARNESRGGHFRTDFPATAPAAVSTRLTLAQARAITAPLSNLAGLAE